MKPTILILVGLDSEQVKEIMDVISGKTAETLQMLTNQTQAVLKQAELISTQPPIKE